MPSTVADIFGAARLILDGVVPWGATIPNKSPGVYVVSLGMDPVSCTACEPLCPISRDALEQWLFACSRLTLDGTRPTVNALRGRLRSFWLSDEVVLYIGKATSLQRRVCGYYNTPLGASKPHAGGHFLKVLNNLCGLSIHYAAARCPARCEHLETISSRESVQSAVPE
jgi:hypothetical protein